MKLLLILLLISLSFPFFAHAQTETNNENKSEKIYTVVEEMPSFPGGQDGLFKYLSKIKYPAQAIEDSVTGRVYITFVIDKTGGISEAKVLRGIGGGCDEAALEIVQKMPKWKPGKQNGVPVNVQYSLPINFNLK
jgi:protein TonB